MKRASPTLLLLCVPFAACVAPNDRSHGALRPGRFVEAKGQFVAGRATVTEIDEVPREADDKSDKVEITAPVESASATSLQMLGKTLAVDAETTFEAADKSPRAPFVPAQNDWLRVKARDKADSPRARTVRSMEPREQFKVTGEVRRYDEDAGEVDVGGVRLPLAQNADVAMLGTRDPNDPLSLFMADDQKAVPFGIRVSDSFRLGGQVSGSVEWNDEFDLDDTDDRDRTKPQFGGKIDALWLFDGAGSYALAEVTASRDDTIRQNGDDTRDETVEVTRAYASFRAADGLQVIAGRQDFDEEREWLYDEVLDGVRGVMHVDRFEFELGGAIGRDFAAAVNDTENTGLLVANVRYEIDPDFELGAYVLQRTDDSAAEFEPLLFGLRSLSRPRLGLGHWIELGGASGDAGNRSIDGYAFDVGLTYAFDAPLRPTVAAGIAFGSGERDGSNTMGYRQSGLQDDNMKLGGVTSVRYYGELLDPELTNLTVTTLAAAIRPLRGLSFSALFHTYRQDVASVEFPDTALRVQPNGTSSDLGAEFDFVLGYRLERRLTIELVASHFEPGDAFAGDTPAQLLALTTRISL